MTPSERERLILLIEEAAEVQQIAAKILRHGYESYHPEDPDKKPNRNLLEMELGDLSFAIQLMINTGDVSNEAIHVSKYAKGKKIQKYLHYNQV
jgi:NTP pyrophosphatase (non-canonical NTP hydrolase)